MINPNECFVGLASSATGLTLVLPRTGYEYAMLVTEHDDRKIGIVFDNELKFWAVDLIGNTHLKGLLIPNVVIEIDETSVFDSNIGRFGAGHVVRKHDQLLLAASLRDGFAGLHELIPVLHNLPACADGYVAGFSKWHITLGEGLDKRVLKEIAVERPTQ